MRHKGFWLFAGVALGTAAAYGLARVYRARRGECAPFRRQVYRGVRELIEGFRPLWEDPAALLSLWRNPDLSRALLQKVVLTVAGAHGSRLVAEVPARHARRKGVSPEQIESLLRGQVAHATVEEAPALFFARHFAETAGQPDGDLVRTVAETYGPRTARDIVTAARLASFAARAGNTLDAMLSRLLGRPAEGSDWRSELAASLTLAFGIVPLVPALVARARLARLAAV